MAVEERRQEAVGRRVVLTYVRHLFGRVLSNSRVADGPGRDVLHGLRGLQRYQKDAVGPGRLDLKIVLPRLARRRPRRPRRAAINEKLGPLVVVQVHLVLRLGLGHLGPAAHAVGVRVSSLEARLAPRIRIEATCVSIPLLAVFHRLEDVLVGDHVPPVVLIVRVERLRREAALLVLHEAVEEALELVVVGILCEVVLIRLATHRLAGLAVLAGERQRAGVALYPALEDAIRDFVGSGSSRVGQVVHDVDRVEVREVRVDAVDAHRQVRRRIQIDGSHVRRVAGQGGHRETRFVGIIHAPVVGHEVGHAHPTGIASPIIIVHAHLHLVGPRSRFRVSELLFRVLP